MRVSELCFFVGKKKKKGEHGGSAKDPFRLQDFLKSRIGNIEYRHLLSALPRLTRLTPHAPANSQLQLTAPQYAVIPIVPKLGPARSMLIGRLC